MTHMAGHEDLHGPCISKEAHLHTAKGNTAAAAAAGGRK
jgi:hypothetical protein